MNENKWMPMCWKCCNMIKREVIPFDNCTPYSVMIGCKENINIKTYNDALTKCPLKKDEE